MCHANKIAHGMSDSKLIEVLNTAPPHQGIKYSYGTAGFRMPNDAGQLNCAILRSSLLACLRSRHLNGQTVGMMVKKIKTLF